MQSRTFFPDQISLEYFMSLMLWAMAHALAKMGCISGSTTFLFIWFYFLNRRWKIEDKRTGSEQEWERLMDISCIG